MGLPLKSAHFKPLVFDVRRVAETRKEAMMEIRGFVDHLGDLGAEGKRAAVANAATKLNDWRKRAVPGRLRCVSADGSRRGRVR
eukprot:2086676-Pyramimonas_sp.AAC.1